MILKFRVNLLSMLLRCKLNPKPKILYEAVQFKTWCTGGFSDRRRIKTDQCRRGAVQKPSRRVHSSVDDIVSVETERPVHRPGFLKRFYRRRGRHKRQVEKGEFYHRTGVSVRPKFDLTPHINGIVHLVGAAVYFGVGTTHCKTGSSSAFYLCVKHTYCAWGYLSEVTILFHQNCVLVSDASTLTRRLDNYHRLTVLMNVDAHRASNWLINIGLPLWNALCIQYHKKSSFKNLDETVVKAPTTTPALLTTYKPFMQTPPRFRTLAECTDWQGFKHELSVTT